MTRSKKRIIFVVKLIITIFFFYLIFRNVSFLQVLSILKTTGPQYKHYILSLLFFTVGVFFQGVLWVVIIRNYLPDINSRKIILSVFDGLVLNTFIPGKFGVIYKGIILKKTTGIDIKKAFSFIVFEQLILFIGLISGTLWISIHFINKEIFSNLYCNIIFVLLVNITVIFIIQQGLFFLKNRIGFLKKIEFVKKLSVKKIFVCSLITTLIYHCLGVSLYFLTDIFTQASIPLSVTGFYSAQLASFAGITPSGWGIREYVLTNYYQMTQMNLVSAASVALLFRAVNIIATLIVNCALRIKFRNNFRIS